MRDLHIILYLASLVFSLVTAGHAVLYKRDTRAALGWLALCLLVPWIGGALYWIFGVNRVQTHAQDLHRRGRWKYLKDESSGSVKTADLEVSVPASFEPLHRLSTAVTQRPLLAGNQVRLLRDGEEAYPAMLEAIGAARDWVYLSTYIFDSDETGRRFVAALSQAVARGVRVRVLVDAFGAQYSFPQVSGLLKRAQVPFSKFLPFSLSLDRFHPNLRNHRKMLLVDNRIAFTGGMNIGDRHLAQKLPRQGRVSDLHFALTGPVTQELQNVFLEDWFFSSGESIAPAAAAGPMSGEVLARVVSSGPNEDFEKLSWILLGALSAAREKVKIITPYFVPDRVMISALNAAALRGIRVEIILPQKNNLPFVGWASRALLGEMLEKGVHFYYQPPPFAHTKLMVVDGYYGLIGSSNWDARSFRLNFELDVETYGLDFAGDLEGYFQAVQARVRPVTLEDLRRDSFFSRFRNAFFNLFSPYL